MAKVGVRNDICLKSISPSHVEENPLNDVFWESIDSSKSSKVSSTKKRKNRTTENSKIISEQRKNENEFSKIDYKLIKPAINKLLNRFRDTESNLKVTEKLRSLTYDYQKDTKEYLTTLRKILKSNMEVRKRIQKTEKEFRFLSQATSAVNILSWTMDIMMVLSMPIILKYSASPRSFILLSSITGSLSICGSLFAFSHAKRKVEEISKILKTDKSCTIELEKWYRNSRKIEKEIHRLFPYGIDQDLIDQDYIDGSKAFESELSWKKYICSILIASNIQHDARLLMDENFLATVKQFIENPVAHIWWNRLKTHKVMNGVIRRLNDTPEEVLTSCSEAFQNRAVVSLFPVTIPLLVAPMKQYKIRLILGALGAALAAFDLAESKDDDDFDELKRIVHTMKREYAELEKICITMDSEYD